MHVYIYILYIFINLGEPRMVTNSFISLRRMPPWSPEPQGTNPFQKLSYQRCHRNRPSSTFSGQNRARGSPIESILSFFGVSATWTYKNVWKTKNTVRFIKADARWLHSILLLLGSTQELQLVQNHFMYIVYIHIEREIWHICMYVCIYLSIYPTIYVCMYVWCVMCDVWCVMCAVCCVMCDVWCVICDMWYVMWCDID